MRGPACTTVSVFLAALLVSACRAHEVPLTKSSRPGVMVFSPRTPGGERAAQDRQRSEPEAAAASPSETASVSQSASAPPSAASPAPNAPSWSVTTITHAPDPSAPAVQRRPVALHQGAASNFWRHTRQYRGMILVAIAAVLALLVILTLSRGRILG